MHLYRRLLSIGACCLLINSAQQSLAEEHPPLAPERLKQHVDRLAGPDFNGRLAGTADERRAAEYLAQKLDEFEVPPLAGKRYQTFAFQVASAGTEPNTAAIVSRDSQNVLGWLEGSDPALRREIIVLGAHYDHLGRQDGRVYPGADDNASGTAVVLEVAAALRKKSADLKRSVAILFFGAEEQGLRGSQYLVRDCPFELTQVAVMINVDMIGRPLADLKSLARLKPLLRIDDRRSVGVLGANQHPYLGRVCEEAAAQHQLTVYGTRFVPFLSPLIDNLARNRSDHGPFEERGIRTLFFGSGESDDYHQPTDTPDKIDPQIVASRARLIHDVVLTLSRAEAAEFERPQKK